jgi:hypothetical protein
VGEARPALMGVRGGNGYGHMLANLAPGQDDDLLCRTLAMRLAPRRSLILETLAGRAVVTGLRLVAASSLVSSSCGRDSGVLQLAQ